MNLINPSHREKLRATGWHSRGYLPHYDGQIVPQSLTLRLADSIPKKVIDRWRRELARLDVDPARIILRKRIDKYLDQGYGECFLRDPRIATIVQDALLHFDGERYTLFAWCVMPNHSHSLFTRTAEYALKNLMHTHKSYTAHEANKVLKRTGEFWMKDYYDRFIRNAEHFRNAVRYIENNPVKAGLCKRASDWPFSSAWFRNRE